MIHLKDSGSKMLCVGCSPFDSANALYSFRDTVCPSCQGRADERNWRETSTRRARRVAAPAPMERPSLLASLFGRATVAPSLAATAPAA